MPNTDDRQERGSADAKQWALEQAGRVGEAVRHWRNKRSMTAVQLASRTTELGYPITRGTIARIEGNHRLGKMDIAELVALAAALDVPPILLLYPEMPDGYVEATPGRTMSSKAAASWWAGRPDDWMVKAKSDAEQLMNAVWRRPEHIEQRWIRAELEHRQMGGTPRDIGELKAGEWKIRQEMDDEIRGLGGTVSDG